MLSNISLQYGSAANKCNSALIFSTTWSDRMFDYEYTYDGFCIFPRSSRLKSRETFIKCSSKAETSKLLFLHAPQIWDGGWHMWELMKIENLLVLGGVVGGVETWQSFITDITDLTDRPSGNPGMDVSHHSEYDKMWCDERIYDIWYLWYQNFICLNKVLKAFKTLSGRLVAWVDVLLW